MGEVTVDYKSASIYSILEERPGLAQISLQFI